MSPRAAFSLIGLVLLSVFCLNAAEGKQPSEERDRAVVQVSGPKTEAIEMVLAAFVAEDLMIARSEGGIVTPSPVVVKSLGFEIGQVTYSATVIGLSDAHSQVIVVALYSEFRYGGSLGPDRSTGPIEKPVTSQWKKMFIPHWQRVERIAARLQNTQQQLEAK